MFSAQMGKRLKDHVRDYVVFDLETTGISPYRDQVVEISAVKVVGGVPTDEFTTLVNPGMHIPAQASAVNGITDDMVADAPAFDYALKAFMEFVGDMVLVGHNIHSFDMKFICRDSEKFFGQTIGNDYIDTLFMARKYLPTLPHHTLTDLARYYSISTRGAHRALNDCRMNRQVFEKLVLEAAASPQASEEERICPKCGSELKLRSGRFGEFWGCTGYPGCRYTENKE